MKNKIQLVTIILLTLTMLIIPNVVVAEYYKETLTPKEMKEDIDFLVRKIESTFPAVVNGFNDEQKKIIEEVYQKIQEPLPLKTFYYYANEIIVSLKCGHTRLNKTNDIHWLNIPFLWLDDGMIVNRTRGQLLKGDKIVSIGGKTEKELLNELIKIIPSENIYWVKQKASEELNNSWTLEFMGLINSDYKVNVRIERDGQELDFEIPLDDRFLITKEAAKKKWFFWEIEKENSLGYFFLSRCYSDPMYRLELKEFFNKVEEDKIDNIVLDLRYNTGGTNECMFQFTEYLDIDKYEVYGYEMRLSDEIKEWLIKDNKYREGERTKQNIYTGVNNKKDTTFTGNVFLLTGADTWSAATLWTYFFKYNKIGTIMGEPTGNSPSMYGSNITYTLPNSYLTADISHKTITWPGIDIGFPDSVYPDISIKTTRFDIPLC